MMCMCRVKIDFILLSDNFSFIVHKGWHFGNVLGERFMLCSLEVQRVAVTVMKLMISLRVKREKQTGSIN